MEELKRDIWASHVTLVVKKKKKKNLCVNDGDTRDTGLFPEMFPTIPGEGNGNPFQCFWLENRMDRGAWWTTVHEAAKCQA